MCIAILNSSSTIDKITFMTCWENNPDGAGIAYIENNTIKILKEMDFPERLYFNYVELRKNNLAPMIIHFRIATSGSIDEDNCHPFPVHPGLVMAHNGILDNIPVEPGSKVNDTRIFINDILSMLPENFTENTGIQRLLSGFIGDSKLVFLDKNGNYVLINESLGHWDDTHENWFSNYSYLNEYAWGNSRRLARHTARYPAIHGYDECDWAMCEGCENWVETEELVHDKYLGAIICSDCQEYYYQNLIHDV